ncbi:MAG: hypothetical protein RL217_1678 [Pseudomonadota bacterium]|jgi:uncharacterized membrane protein YedE/YeeE
MVNELLGGALIGLAAAGLWLGIGRISGMTAVISGLFAWPEVQRRWVYAFIFGLMLAYPAFYALGGSSPISITSNKTLLISAGLLVGFGTYIGNGCTSGHGVCGMGRFSLRSIIATCTFISAGMATVALMNLIGGAL